MPTKPIEAAQTFIKQLAAKLPEAARASFVAQFDGQDEALTTLGDSVLNRADYSRAMNELARIEKEQKDWYAANKPLMELGAKAKEAGFDPAAPDGGGGDGRPDPAGTVSRDALLKDVTTLIDEREMGAAHYFADLNVLSLSHFQQFGEILDTRTLTQETAKDPQRRGLKGYYEFKYAERLAEKRKAAADKDFDARYQARRNEELKQERNRPPDTVTGGPSSPLDALNPVGAGAAGPGVQELVDEYNTLVAAQTAGR